MQTINLSLHKKTIIPVLYAKQGEVGRKFQTVFTDGIPDGVTFSVWYSSASGEGNYTSIGDRSAFAINGNTVTVELITQMLNNAGEGKLCLVMSGADGSQLGSWNVPYEVEHVPGMGSDTAEQYYTAFSEVIKDLPYPDVSLTAAGKAADAAATGAAIKELSNKNPFFGNRDGISSYPTRGGIYRTTGTNIFTNLQIEASQCYGVLVIFEAGYGLHIYLDTYGNLFYGRSGDSFGEPAAWHRVAKEV